jgi:hypothetical protein
MRNLSSEWLALKDQLTDTYPTGDLSEGPDAHLQKNLQFEVDAALALGDEELARYIVNSNPQLKTFQRLRQAYPSLVAEP